MKYYTDTKLATIPRSNLTIINSFWSRFRSIHGRYQMTQRLVTNNVLIIRVYFLKWVINKMLDHFMKITTTYTMRTISE